MVEKKNNPAVTIGGSLALIQLFPLVLKWIYYVRRPQVGETAPPGVQLPKWQAAWLKHLVSWRKRDVVNNHFFGDEPKQSCHLSAKL